jgi:flagellar motor switch/type III secretory pathway protein FliN
VNVTPYLLLKRSRAEQLSQRLLAALGEWAAGWAALPDHAVACSDACEAGQAALEQAWHRRVLADGAEVWTALPRDAQRWMEQLVFGQDDGAPPSPLAGSVATEALEALQGQLLHALTGQASRSEPDAAPALAMLRRGAGTVLCTVQLGARALRLLLPAAAQGMPAPTRRSATPVAPLREALAALPVPLTVDLCRAELTLGYLRTLAVGDVLALPMALDAALQVRGPGAGAVCAAHLGALDGHRAVELSKQAGGPDGANEPRKAR